ncbi:hypothetical protein ElyMa_000126100 [Elysia marginata]|uniref:Uncharacterized protein n=1 Tax=Elysia marginata TaxID=1093978 RepID=A0AAV4EME1_9GAST|nr:hypothetical protein ElyMa_000126100 [Elysia marginata]
MPQPVRHKDRDYCFEDSDGSQIRRKEKIVETVGIPDDIRNVGKLVLYQSSPHLGQSSPGTSSLERKKKSHSPFRASPAPPVRESEKDYTYRGSEGTLRRHKERVTERVGIPDDVIGLGKLVLSQESSYSKSRQVSSLEISSGVRKSPAAPLSPQKTPPPTLRKNYTYRESDRSLWPRREPVKWAGSRGEIPNGVTARQKPPSRDSSDERHVSTLEIPRNKPAAQPSAYRSPPTTARTTYSHRERTDNFVRRQENITERVGIPNNVNSLGKVVIPSSRESSEERHKSSLYHPVSPGKPKSVSKNTVHKVSAYGAVIFW